MAVGDDDQGLATPYRNWPNFPAMGATRSSTDEMFSSRFSVVVTFEGGKLWVEPPD